MKKLLSVLLAIMTIASLLASCSEETQTVSSSDISSVESTVPNNVSSIDSTVSDNSSSMENVVSDESTVSQAPVASEEPKVFYLVASSDPAGISLDEALCNYYSEVIDGELYFLQAANEDKDVNISLLRYDYASATVKTFMSFTVKNGQAYDVEKDEPASSRCNAYKSVAGNTVFTSSNFDFKLYIDMTNKQAFVYSRDDVYRTLPTSITGKSFKKSYTSVEYSPDTVLSGNQVFKSHPEYGDQHSGDAEVLDNAYVAVYKKDSRYTLCLYNYDTKKFYSLFSADVRPEYEITEGGRYLVFAHYMEKDVYCCDIQTGKVKSLPVTARPLDNRTDEGEETYFIGDLNIFSDSEKLYWEDYDKSTNRMTLCCFDFDKGTNVKVYELPEFESVTYYLLTDKGIYIQSEIPWGTAHHTSFKKDIFFYDGEKLWTIAEDVMDFHLLENENVMYVQKEAENKFLFERIELSEVLS